ncbi:hypothetical protein, partial [Galactobacillus timonensis]|uniref:hypothetical protein n=1 Tax=Galactobacillus timonensis TaxID=2041840 RepID=UPI0023F11C77
TLVNSGFFIAGSFQGFSPKVSPKVNRPSPPKSPPEFLASPPTFLESQKAAPASLFRKTGAAEMA